MTRSAPRSSRSRLRRLWFNVHLWLGVALLLAFVPLGLSGAALVWADALDAGLHPLRQVAATTDRLPPSAYLAAANAAAEASGEGMRAAQITYPIAAHRPVVVTLRGGGGRPDGAGRRAPGRSGRGPADPGGEAAERIKPTRDDKQSSRRPPGDSAPTGAPQRPRGLSVYLNPSTAKILDTAPLRSGPIAFLHQFHESLLIPGWGRTAVGWLGVAMLISSVTGLYLWWPRGAWLKGLAYRRTPLTTLNLHYTAGFWIALPLALLSLTGIGLGFPKATRGLIAQVAPVGSAQGGPAGRGQAPMGQTALDVDTVMIRAGASPQTLAAIGAPTRARPVWRVETRPGATLEVNDATGVASPAAAQPSGDVAYRWIRRIHAGQDLPLIWRVILTLGGLAPTLLGVTGLIAWISRGVRRQALKA